MISGALYIYVYIRWQYHFAIAGLLVALEFGRRIVRIRFAYTHWQTRKIEIEIEDQASHSIFMYIYIWVLIRNAY